MFHRIDIYIGSDNGSKRIDESYVQAIKKWANSVFPEGYTLLRGEGCYRGIYEDSVLVNVLSDGEIALRDQLKRLKLELNQESILVATSSVELEVV